MSITKCTLGWHDGSCCCNCKNHYEDFHHCTTKKKEEGEDCVCSQHKGYICMISIDGITKAYSGWSEHGFCELHVPNVELK